MTALVSTEELLKGMSVALRVQHLSVIGLGGHLWAKGDHGGAQTLSQVAGDLSTLSTVVRDIAGRYESPGGSEGV